jgi:hypothetical protein
MKCIILIRGNKINVIEPQVLTAVTTKSSIFWEIRPCSPLIVNGRFGGTYRLHLHGRKYAKQEASMKQVASRLCWFLAWLTFRPEDGSDVFLRTVGWLSTNYMTLYPLSQETELLEFNNDNPTSASRIQTSNSIAHHFSSVLTIIIQT